VRLLFRQVVLKKLLVVVFFEENEIQPKRHHDTGADHSEDAHDSNRGTKHDL
jgi:hypothetical protein